MAKAKIQYVCQNCGYSSSRYLGRCPNCGEWNSLVEEKVQSATPTSSSRVSLAGVKTKPTKIKEIKMGQTPRTQTKIRELDRVLGGELFPDR